MSKNYLIILLVTSGLLCDCANNSLPVYLNSSLNHNENNERQLNVLKISKIFEEKLNEIRTEELGIPLIQVKSLNPVSFSKEKKLIDLFKFTGNF